MPPTKQLESVVKDQLTNVMPGEGCSYTPDNPSIVSATSGGLLQSVALGTTFVRVASLTDPTKYKDVPVNVVPPAPSGLGLTSPANGFLRGFYPNGDATITNDATMQTQLKAALNNTAIYPADARVTYLNDPTYGKVCRLAPTAQFEYYITGTGTPKYTNLRHRLVMRYIGHTLADLYGRRIVEFADFSASPARKVSLSYSGTGALQIQIGDQTLSQSTTNGSPVTSIVNESVHEAILEFLTNGDSTYTTNLYFNAVGATRTIVATFTTSAANNPPNAPQYNAVTFGGQQTTPSGGFWDFMVSETCNARDGGGAIIPIANLGS